VRVKSFAFQKVGPSGFRPCETKGPFDETALDPLAQIIAESPELFPLALDFATDRVTLVRFGEGDYARASFLDERLLTEAATPRRLVPWQLLEQAAASLPARPSNYIFHIGHVGSTLLSRLLGKHPEVLALREPAILRSFVHSPWTEEEFDRRLDTALRLLARTFRQQQRSLVKATSFVSELAPRILSRRGTPRAVFMFVPAETYLATILGAENSPAEARALAPSRLRRLHARIGEERWNLDRFSLGEVVAMGWACEISALVAAAAVAANRVLWMNFDRFLEDPANGLSSAFVHLETAATPDEITAIVAGPELRHYSKAPQHAYDSTLRRMVLEDGRKTHGAEIARGLAWLDQAAADFRLIPRQLNHA
jgi:hypothetical protein